MQQVPSLFVRGKGLVNFMSRVGQSMALSVEVFLRHGMGEEYVARRWIRPAMFVILLAVVFRDHQPVPFLVFYAAFVGLCIVHNVACVARRWLKRPPIHSRYSGRPWVKLLLKGVSEETIKRVEPLAVALIGRGIFEVNHLLGLYLVVAALGMAWSNILNALALHRQARNLNDSVVEQELIVERFREMRGELV